MKIPARMSSDVKNSTANDMTCPLRVITFFRFLRMLKISYKMFFITKKSESLQTEGRHFRSMICKLSDV